MNVLVFYLPVNRGRRLVDPVLAYLVRLEGGTAEDAEGTGAPLPAEWWAQEWPLTDNRTGLFETGPQPKILNSYLLEVLCPSFRKRSCSLRRRMAGVLGLNATRYHSGWLRSRESHARVVASALGWRATFSRIAA